MKASRLMIFPILTMIIVGCFSCTEESDSGVVGVWTHTKRSGTIEVETNYPELTLAIIKDMQVDREDFDYELKLGKDGAFEYVQNAQLARKGNFTYNAGLISFDGDIGSKVVVHNQKMVIEVDAKEAYSQDVIADLIAYDETLAHINPNKVVLKKAAFVSEYSKVGM